ncbi:MAG: hypothetical protein KIPDCIKN_03282 [Haliscomenobacter sp.]|jgi:thioredoxin-related protein|nr:hypothetical protein [Haliscomenobacter sp.]
MRRIIAFLAGGIFFSFSPLANYAQQHTFFPKGQVPSSSVTLKQASSPSTTLNWSSWQSYQANEQDGKKKVLISIYTDWCSWCKRMDTETFANPMVAKYLNEHFALVKINAEQKEEILFRGKKYGYTRVGDRNYNALAAELLNGRISFPALVFLSEDEEVIQPISGFKSAEELMPILMYIGSDEYQRKPWTTFQKEFKMPEKNK